MDSKRAAAMSRLAPLTRRRGQATAKRCKVCAGPAGFFDVVDFYKFCDRKNPHAFGASGVAIYYFRCQSCGFLFTPFFDDWTAEEFSTHLYNADYIKVDGEYEAIRPARQADMLARRFAPLKAAKILDYGGGSGVMARRMRELGFAEVVCYDPFSSPERPTGTFDVVTCFEVIEHSPFPHKIFADMLSFLKPDGCVIFSQALQPANIGELRGNWWYIGPRNGHVSMFTAQSLARLAASHGAMLYRGAGDTFGLGRERQSALARQALAAIGRPYQSVELRAPADDATAGEAGFYLPGGPDRSSRWTRSARLQWQLPVSLPCTGAIHVSIPFAQQVRDGFAAGCRVRAGEMEYPVCVEHNIISAEIEPAADFDGVMELLTPEPASPHDLRGSADRRKLGLDIPMPRGPAS